MQKSNYKEIVFIGLPGPSHNYGGLAPGDLASEKHAGNISQPTEAALQVIKLAEVLHEKGVTVAILPPHPRPYLQVAEKIGYQGSHKDIIKLLAAENPKLLSMLYSSASMWAANSATVTPAADAKDKKLHIMPANLISNLHRSIEAEHSYKIFSQILADKNTVVHEPLPNHVVFGDEGAANHMRMAAAHGEKGLNIFVFGKEATVPGSPAPKLYPARQTKEASEAIARLHNIPESQTVFIKQNPEVIDQGVFHNDVIALSHLNLLLYHEHAFSDKDSVIYEITSKFKSTTGNIPVFIEVMEGELSVGDAVHSYFFNSQIISDKDGNMIFIAPQEVKENNKAKKLIDKIIADKTNPISSAIYVDLKQSMQNGGGPACLRLRAVLSDEQIKHMEEKTNIIFNYVLAEKLRKSIKKYYPEMLEPKQLASPDLYRDAMKALEDIEKILNLQVSK